MAKQDVLDAINATIAPNNIKGITAESLNNVLTLMTENAGEGGSGDGALRVIVPEMMMFGEHIISVGELSPASWEEMKLIIEADGLDVSTYDATVKASFEHNANVAHQLLDKARAGQGVSVILDQTPYSQAFMDIQNQMGPEMAQMVESFALSMVQPARLVLQYAKYTPEGESMIGMGEMFACMLAPTGMINSADMGAAGYPPHIIIILNLDGSLTFTPIEEEQPSSGSGVVTFYMAEGNTISDEIKAKNASAFSQYLAAEEGISVVIQNPQKARFIPSFVSVSEEAILFELVTSRFSEGGEVSASEVEFYPDGSYEF